MPKILVRLNNIHLQVGSWIFEEDLIATKQPFVFIAHGRHCEHVEGELSKIGLAVVSDAGGGRIAR